MEHLQCNNLLPPPAYATLCLPPHSTTSNRILSNPPLIAPLCHLSSPHTAALWASWLPHSPSASLEAILALSLPFPSQWQAVSPSEKTPDLKRALRTLLSKMKVNVTCLQWNIHTHIHTHTPAVIRTLRLALQSASQLSTAHFWSSQTYPSLPMSDWGEAESFGWEWQASIRMFRLHAAPIGHPLCPLEKTRVFM